MEPITAARILDGFRLKLTFEHAEELHDVAEYLEERLIGRMPALVTALQGALWSAEDRPATLLPVINPDKLLEPHDGNEWPRMSDELADAEGAALEQHITWGESAAGRRLSMPKSASRPTLPRSAIASRPPTCAGSTSRPRPSTPPACGGSATCASSCAPNSASSRTIEP